METAGETPEQQGKGAILVLPTVAAGQQGPVAAWVSAAGWANGLRRRLGDVGIVTPEGGVVPAELRGRGSPVALAAASAPRWHHRIPVVVKPATKDAREWKRARRFHINP